MTRTYLKIDFGRLYGHPLVGSCQVGSCQDRNLLGILNVTFLNSLWSSSSTYGPANFEIGSRHDKRHYHVRNLSGGDG